MEHISWNKRRPTSRLWNSVKSRKHKVCEELKMQFTYQFLMRGGKKKIVRKLFNCNWKKCFKWHKATAQVWWVDKPNKCFPAAGSMRSVFPFLLVPLLSFCAPAPIFLLPCSKPHNPLSRFMAAASVPSMTWIDWLKFQKTTHNINGMNSLPFRWIKLVPGEI